jgi:hypothetical protein
MASQFDLAGSLLHLSIVKCPLDISDPCRENEWNVGLIAKRVNKMLSRLRMRVVTN